MTVQQDEKSFLILPLIKQILSLLELCVSGVIQAPYAVPFCLNSPQLLDILLTAEIHAVAPPHLLHLHFLYLSGHLIRHQVANCPLLGTCPLHRDAELCTGCGAVFFQLFAVQNK